jgi:hypothetical protein
MSKRAVTAIAAAMIASSVIVSLVAAEAAPHGAAASSGYEPVLDPANFTRVIDNPYYPLPVGRVLVYKGIRDGVHQIDRVTVTHGTRVLEGITATTVLDVATQPNGRLIEKTRDWYAQDRQGNVWYLGEATKAYNPDGTVDTSGSWLAGVNDGEPGVIMEAHPRVPDAYRQEFLAGEAEDTAWVVATDGSMTVPYGRVRHVLSTLEATVVEPGSYDLKVYAPGLGIVFENSLTGQEIAKLVRVKN